MNKFDEFSGKSVAKNERDIEHVEPGTVLLL